MAVSAGGFVDVGAVVQNKKGLDLPDYLAARAIGLEHLVEKAKESAANGEDTFSAIGSFVGLGQQSRRQEPAENLVQLHEALLAELAETSAQGARRRRQAGKKGVFMAQY